MPDGTANDGGTRAASLFALMNEVAIIEQLARTILESRLPDGASQPHFAVLNHLVRVADGRTPMELARAFQVPKTSMTNTLAGLEKRGLVEMRPNPDDGRSKRVWITDGGREFRDDAIAALAPDLAAMDEALDGERLAALVPELARIRAWLDERRGQGGRS